jgi:hypothetical protein
MKIFFTALVILFSLLRVQASTFFTAISGSSSSGASRAPQGSQRYERTVYLLTPAELRTAGFVQGKVLTGIGFSYFVAQTVATTGTFKVYLQNTADITYQKASNNWTNTSSTGIIDNMRLVHNASLTIPATTGNFDIPFTGGATFTYTGGGLYVAFEYQNATGSLAAMNTAYCNTELPSGLRNAYSTTALDSDLTNTSDFRPLTRLSYAAPAQAAVADIYTMGNLLVPGALPHAISARITNEGEATMTNVPVTLSIAGANTYQEIQTVASLAVGSSAVVTFQPLNSTGTMALGTNTVSVHLPTDDNTADNGKLLTQVVSTKSLGYADAEAFSGIRVGYNQGEGLLLTKYQVSTRTTINSVTVGIADASANVGNTVYGVLLDANGNVISRSADYVLTTADLGAYHTFPLATPTSFTKESFYVGLAQTSNPSAVEGYFPLALQEESPARAGAYYSSGLTGGILTEQLSLNRFMILAGVAPTPLPVRWVGIAAERSEADVQVRWQTAMEQGNDHFEVERSSDGQSFATVGRVMPTSVNSQYTHNYSFLDVGATRSSFQQLYYRLKQVDVDGTTSYSPVVVIAMPTAGMSLPTAYPNPLVNILHLEALPSGALIRVTDVTGRLLYTEVATTPTLALPVDAWIPGVYCLQVSMGNQSLLTQRLIK